jgi:hypothetical protein
LLIARPVLIKTPNLTVQNLPAMKELFICAGFVTCSVIGYAQQTPPSFRNYLDNNKSVQPHDPHTFTLSGKSNIDINALANGNHLKMDALKKYLHKEKINSTLVPGALAELLPNGNKIIVLPQDRMPCIVPDLSQFHMPIAEGNNELDKRINVSSPW